MSQNTEPEFLRRRDAIQHIKKTVDISPSTFDRMRKEPGFPEAVKLRPTTRTQYWPRRELDQFLASMPEAA